MVSVCGVVVATIALVCALSVYNGFNDLVSSLFSNFDPELKIMPRKGKVFDPTSEEIRKVRELPGIVCFSEVLQDNALVRYRDRQGVATLKGVDEQYEKLAQIDSILIDGNGKHGKKRGSESPWPRMDSTTYTISRKERSEEHTSELQSQR